MLFVFAVALHVLAVVHWIGGVALVTTVILPIARRMDTAEDRLHIFELVESRFAPQARISVLVVGITGLYMLNHRDLWMSMLSPMGWWLSRMLEPDEAAFGRCSPHCNGPIDLIVRQSARFEPLSRFASMNWRVQ